MNLLFQSILKDLILKLFQFYLVALSSFCLVVYNKPYTVHTTERSHVETECPIDSKDVEIYETEGYHMSSCIERGKN